jgi:hypothetical protein
MKTVTVKLTYKEIDIIHQALEDSISDLSWVDIEPEELEVIRELQSYIRASAFKQTVKDHKGE